MAELRSAGYQIDELVGIATRRKSRTVHRTLLDSLDLALSEGEITAEERDRALEWIDQVIESVAAAIKALLRDTVRRRR